VLLVEFQGNVNAGGSVVEIRGWHEVQPDTGSQVFRPLTSAKHGWRDNPEGATFWEGPASRKVRRTQVVRVLS
jgi:hypothetical protein